MIRDENLCPNCSSKMISRKGQYGVFWGCSNYPNCKGTRDSFGHSKADRDKEKGIVNDELEDDRHSFGPSGYDNRTTVSFNKKRTK